MEADRSVWPDLPYAAWSDTVATLHLWTQIIGKVRLSLAPWINHSWQVPLYVTARGLSTSPMPCAGELLEIEFDFPARRLRAWTSRGGQGGVALEPQSVADFYARIQGLLRGMDVPVTINELPSELPQPIRFSQDRVHAAYDPAATERFWRALVRIHNVFTRFRSGFLGKVSPVHFFWGSFDLAVTRFSGRPAPLHPGGVPGLSDAVVREAYSHEVSSAGFWPGNASSPQAAFYSYAYPEPPGFRDQPLPEGARYDTALGEFILPYDKVRAAADPEALLLDFLSCTYAAAADCGKWDRTALECPFGIPGRPRPLTQAQSR